MFQVKSQKGWVRPTDLKTSSASEVVRGSQSRSILPSYQRLANSQHCSKYRTAPRERERRSHQLSMDSSDRKYRIVAHVWPMFAQKSRGRTAK